MTAILLAMLPLKQHEIMLEDVIGAYVHVKRGMKANIAQCPSG